MAKKQKEIEHIDGDGFYHYRAYFSKCTLCQHFDIHGYSCKAFPDGIPAEFLSGGKIHDRVTPGQVGSTVFTPSS